MKYRHMPPDAKNAKTVLNFDYCQRGRIIRAELDEHFNAWLAK